MQLAELRYPCTAPGHLAAQLFLGAATGGEAPAGIESLSYQICHSISQLSTSIDVAATPHDILNMCFEALGCQRQSAWLITAEVNALYVFTAMYSGSGTADCFDLICPHGFCMVMCCISDSKHANASIVMQVSYPGRQPLLGCIPEPLSAI